MSNYAYGRSSAPAHRTADIATATKKMQMLRKGTNMLTGRAKFSAYRIADRLIDRAWEYVSYSIKNHFGVELLTGPLGNYQYNLVLDWIKQYDKNWDKHVTVRDKTEYLENKELILPIDEATFVLIRTGKQIQKMMSDTDVILESVNGNRGDNGPTSMYFYFCGKRAYRHHKKMQQIINTKSDVLTCYKISGGAANSQESFRSIAAKMNTRRLETIFLENGVTDKITEHIDRFFAHESIYKDRDLIYKTGILLKGEPGTGKTSLATAIATYCNCDMMIVDMTTFDTLDIQSYTETINADDYRYVVVLEDIDCITGDRQDGELSEEEKARLNKLLQFLDSNSSPTNVIFVATTNYPERLDSALIREGRFDLAVNVKGIYYDKAFEMCKSFGFSDEKIKRILKEIIDDPENDIDLKNKPINQSKLQGIILKNIEDEAKQVIE